MTCVICKNGETRLGHGTVTLERNGTTLVFKSVPAQICDNCGEQYLDEATSERILTEAEQAARAGVDVEIRTFAAA